MSSGPAGHTGLPHAGTSPRALTPGRKRRARAGLAYAAGLALAALGYRAATCAPPAWPAPAEPRLVGSYHVHTERSHDARVPPVRWAAAAAARALDFVVLTDHDAAPAAPERRHGVLLLPQTELSTPHGHLVGLGWHATCEAAWGRDAAAAGRLRAADVWPIAAHPTDPKRPWTGPTAELAGVEPASLSASFDAWLRSPRVLAALPLLAWALLRPAAALCQLYGDDPAATAAWDALAPPALGLCAGDGHGWVPLGLNLSAWHLVLDRLPRGEGGAPPSAEAVLRELGAGRFFNAAGLLGRAPDFTFGARGRDGDGWLAHEGEVAAAGNVACIEAWLGAEAARGRGGVDAGHADGPQANAAAAFELRLLHDGRCVQRVRGGPLRWLHPAPGAWRVEAWAPLPRPWGPARWAPVLYSNRVTLQGAPAGRAP